MGVIFNDSTTIYSGVTGQSRQTIFGAIQADTVTLLVFPPRHHAMQVVRPYTYNFTEAMVNSITGPDPTNILDFRNNNVMALDAVRPNNEAIVANIDDFSSRWTFILILDNRATTGSELLGGGPKQRTILTGYFIHPPVAETTLWMSTPVINKKALMIFTHNDSLENKVYGYGPNGANGKLKVKSSNDIVHQVMGQHYLQEMGLCDVSDIATGFSMQRHTQALMKNGSMPVTLSEMHAGGQHIPNHLGSAHGHLARICEATEATASQYLDGQIVSDALLMERGHAPATSPYVQAGTTFMGGLQKTRDYSMASAIDPTQPMLLEDLDMLYGNRLHLHFSKAELPPQLDIRNPLEMSAENIYGYMAANTISSYCNELGISAVQFVYSSWGNNVYLTGNSRRGTWELKNIATYVSGVEGTTDDNLMKSAWANLQNILELALWPIIKHYLNGTDFVITVHYTACTDTALCLNSMDNGIIRNEFNVHHNRLGGLLNPNLGTYNNLTHNVDQLKTLAGSVINNLVFQHEGVPQYSSWLNGYLEEEDEEYDYETYAENDI